MIERPIQAVCPWKILCQADKPLMVEVVKETADFKHREVKQT